MVDWGNEVHDQSWPQLLATLAGPLQSSNRTELAAIILAALAPVPLHIASDSVNTSAGAEEIPGGAVDLARKPWALRTNVDLWARFLAILSQRGFSSFRTSKVKAHLTFDEAVAKGISEMLGEATARTIGQRHHF